MNFYFPICDTLLHNILTYICRVKILAIILSIYVLALSSLPCRDIEGCHTLNKGKTPSAQTTHADHHGHTNACSPFCTCCGSTIAFNFQFPLLVPDNQSSFFTQRVKNILHDDSFFSNFYGNIWQPPKI
ncbi:MAG TPA: hypothetical protein DCM71_20255 [Runella sp.]|nr:hypothetical protein [Runella sp.]